MSDSSDFNKNKVKRETSNKKKKRTESKLVLLNEEELIQQVCMRPVIYDRSLKCYRKTSLRKQCWSEISKAMNATEEECRKRWRSLRDSFAKHYKVAQKASANVASKQSKWVFYDQMSFLIPHLDGFSYDLDKMLDEFGDISEDARSMNSEPIDLNAASQEREQKNQQSAIDINKHVDEHNESLQHSSISLESTKFMPNPTANSPIQSPMHINDNGTSSSFCKHTYACNNHSTSAKTILCSEADGSNNGVLLDSDKNFLLSCAFALRRLTHRQNALARLKIQQILFDIEFNQKNN